MAVSLAFGVMFATLITLILVPVLYRIQEDLQRGVRSYFGLRRRRVGERAAGGEAASEA